MVSAADSVELQTVMSTRKTNSPTMPVYPSRLISIYRLIKKYKRRLPKILRRILVVMGK